MTKAVKLLTNGAVEIIDVPDRRSLLDWFYQQIDCTCIENVYPRGLEYPYMLVVDGESLLKDRPTINFLASWLYETQDHGQPICGTALLMQRVMTDDGPDIGGIPGAEAGKKAIALGRMLPEAVIKIRKKLGDQLKDE